MRRAAPISGQHSCPFHLHQGQTLLKSHFDPSPILRVGMLLLTLMSLPSAHAAAPAGGDIQSQIEEANRLYENLEYEQALEQIRTARRSSPTEDDRITLQLYEGIFLCELGKLDKGGEVFESALRAYPVAQLPISVPPKVARLFESRREKILDEQSAKARARADAPVAPLLSRPLEESTPLDLETHAAVKPRPLTQRWYFWAAVGVTAAVAVGGIIWATSSPLDSDTACGGACDGVINPPIPQGISF